MVVFHNGVGREKGLKLVLDRRNDFREANGGLHSRFLAPFLAHFHVAACDQLKAAIAVFGVRATHFLEVHQVFLGCL